MGRPRTPSNVLEMRGSFDKDPQRRREDASGRGDFDREPPEHLPQECVRAWRFIVDRLPPVSTFATDEVAVEVCARLLSTYWMSGNLDTLKELRQWLMQLGFSPVARTKLATEKPGETENPFAKLRS